MNKPTDSNSTDCRTHFLSIAISKTIFAHKLHGIVFSRDSIRLEDAKKFGLSPLIMYGIGVPGISFKWVDFAPLESPKPISSVLQEGWRKAVGLRGYPDVLIVNRHIAEASPGLASLIASLGVKLVVADGKNKALSSHLRTTQMMSDRFDTLWLEENKGPVNSLDLLRRAASSYHRFDVEMITSCSPPNLAHVLNWLALSVRSVDINLPDTADWKPGSWLASWENGVPVGFNGYFSKDNSGKTRIRRMENEDAKDGCENLDDEPTFADDGNPQAYYAEDQRVIIKEMLAVWPNKPVDVARFAGTTLKELQWFLSGRKVLPEDSLFSLRTLFRIRKDEDGYLQVDGPYVLIADSLAGLHKVYDRISHSGDLDYSFEVLPDKGPADPSWRYMIFCSCSGYPNIIMIPRGTAISEYLSEGMLVGFSGSVSVPVTFYRDVVSTSAKAGSGLANNLEEMIGFMKRQDFKLLINKRFSLE